MRRAKAKQSQAKARHAGRNGEDDTANHEEERNTNSSGGASSASSDSDAPVYTLFDGREDLIQYWHELEREEKEEILTLTPLELAHEMNSILLGSNMSSSGVSTAHITELTNNPQLMTATRCAFIDAIYDKGEVKSFELTSLQDTGVRFLLYTMLSVIERHTLLSYERENIILRSLLLLIWYIYSLSIWPWWIRYPLLILLAFGSVALSNAARMLLSEDENVRKDLTPRWQRVAEYYLTAKHTFIDCFNHPTNPILLRARVEIFFSTLVILDLATWFDSRRYWILIVLIFALPYGILHLEKGGNGGRNRSLEKMFPTTSRGEDAKGMKYLRILAISFSNLVVLYFVYFSWSNLLFFSFFFFPSATTVVVSSTAIGIAGFFLVFNKIQSSMIGEWDQRKGMYWMIWLLSILSLLLGYGSSYGWILWFTNWFLLFLFIPPILSHIIQIAGGGLCALLLSVGVHALCQVCIKLGQLILTKEGLKQVGPLIVQSGKLIWAFIVAFVKAMIHGVPPEEGQGGSADTGSATNGHSSNADASNASEMN